MKWKKENVEPIEIESVPDEHNAYLDYEPSFWWNNRRYHLCNFLRAHSPWVSSELPDFIHGYEAENYYNPIFIEIVDDEAVNIWREVPDDNYR